MSSNIACPFCLEKYEKNDEIYATNCGHVFHFLCLQKWKSRQTICPQCREYNPKTYKLYLDFESCEDDFEYKQLQKKLVDVVESSSKFQHQLENSEKNCEDLIEQLEEMRQEKIALKLKLQKYENDDVVHVGREGLIIGGDVMDLYSGALIDGDDSKSSDKIKSLERKLQQTVARMDEVVKDSIKYQIEIMKLKGLVKIYEDEASQPTNSHRDILLPKVENKMPSGVNNRGIYEMNNKKPEDKKEEDNKSCPIQSFRVGVIVAKEAPPPPNARDNVPANDKGKCVIIDFVPYELKKLSNFNLYVRGMATMMGLKCSENDIENITILDRNRGHIQYIALVVSFKSVEMKMKFLDNKDALKRDNEMKEYEIKNYSNLYSQACALKSVGYKVVYCKRGKVFARKDKGSDIIYIRNITHLNELLEAAEIESAKLEQMRLDARNKIRHCLMGISLY